MSVENPNDLRSKDSLLRAQKEHYKTFSDILENKVTQRESQMKYSIYKVLTALDSYGRVNTSKIHEVSGLNWTSLRRSFCMLVDKKIVTMEQHSDKKNNEKLYSIKLHRAIIYLHHIFDHKRMYKDWKKRVKYYDSFATLNAKFPPNFYNWWIFLTPRMRKKIGIDREFCLIRELTENEIIEILKYYDDGSYCENCQNNPEKLGLPKNREFLYLTELIRKDEDTEICEICHSEQRYSDRRLREKNRREYRIGTVYKSPKTNI